MRRRFLMVICAVLFALNLNGYSQDQNRPLSPSEERGILNLLIELRNARGRLATYEELVDGMRQLAERERAVATREVEVERRLTSAAERERDIERTRADEYKALWEAATKRPNGFKCFFKKLFTAGLGTCI